MKLSRERKFFVVICGLALCALGFLVAMPALSGSLLRIPFSAWVDTTGGRKPFLVLLVALRGTSPEQRPEIIHALNAGVGIGLESLLIGIEPTEPNTESAGRRFVIMGFLLAICALPLDPAKDEILVRAGFYALAALGLNVVVGLAGLLDLGYVAFYMLGAYTVALMTQSGNVDQFHIVEWPVWASLPFAVIVAMLVAVRLGGSRAVHDDLRQCLPG